MASLRAWYDGLIARGAPRPTLADALRIRREGVPGSLTTMPSVHSYGWWKGIRTHDGRLFVGPGDHGSILARLPKKVQKSVDDELAGEGIVDVFYNPRTGEVIDHTTAEELFIEGRWKKPFIKRPLGIMEIKQAPELKPPSDSPFNIVGMFEPRPRTMPRNMPNIALATAGAAAFSVAQPDEAQAGKVFRTPAVRVRDKVFEAPGPDATHFDAINLAAEAEGIQNMDKFFAAGKLQMGFVTNDGRFVGAGRAALRFPKTFGESTRMRKAGLLTAAGVAGAAAADPVIEKLRAVHERMELGAKRFLGGAGIPTDKGELQDLFETGRAVLTDPAGSLKALQTGAAEALVGAVARPRETGRAAIRAMRENPEGTAGLLLGNIIPLRPTQFLRGRRLPALLSWPAEVARQSGSPQEFVNRLTEPVRRMQEKLATAKPGETIGKVRDFIDSPDLRAHLHPDVLEVPIKARTGRGSFASVYAGPQQIGPMEISTGAFLPHNVELEIPKALPEIAPVLEDVFRKIFGEEVLHLSRGVAPGKYTARLGGGQLRPAPTGGREFGPYTTRSEGYYSQNPQESAIGRAMGYEGHTPKGFASAIIPDESLFERFGLTSIEFWEQVNSSAFTQAPRITVRQGKRIGQSLAKRVAHPGPEYYDPSTQQLLPKPPWRP